MTSLLTNIAAQSALQTLRSIGRSMLDTEQTVSSGLRIRAAEDDAAYWSISTSMDSHTRSLAAVVDTLGLAAAKVDVAYAGLTQTESVLSEIRARLIAAHEHGVDPAHVQTEIDALVAQTVSIAASSSFNGVNWLSTAVPDVEVDTYLTASYAEGAGIGTIPVNLWNTSLYNVDGGGILQADPRSPKTIGGIRLVDGAIPIKGPDAQCGFQNFSGPLDFSSGGSISFNITINADMPGDGTDPGDSYAIVIDQAAVDTALGNGDGIISTKSQMIAVLNSVLYSKGVEANGAPGVNAYGLYAHAYTGHPGSSMKIENLVSTLAGGNTGALLEIDIYGDPASLSLSFTPFKVFEDVVITFDATYTGTTEHFTIDRDLIDEVLPGNNGWVQSANEMATVLNTLMGSKGYVSTASGSSVKVTMDTAVDNRRGGKTWIQFSHVSVNIEPISDFNLSDIDIVSNPDLIDEYLTSLDTMLGRVTSGAAYLGAITTRIDMQSAFIDRLSDAYTTGIGRLRDADMHEASTRLRAIETQQQLALQALSIANSSPEHLLSLFAT